MKSQLVYLILLIVLAQSQGPTAEEIAKFQEEAKIKIKQFNEQARLGQKILETQQKENSKFADAFSNGETQSKGPNRLLNEKMSNEPNIKFVEIPGKYSQTILLPMDNGQHDGSNMENQIPHHMRQGEQIFQKMEQILEQNNKNTRPHRLFQEQGWINSDPNVEITLKQKLMVQGMDGISKKYSPMTTGSNFNGMGRMQELRTETGRFFKIPYYFINSNDDLVEYQVILEVEIIDTKEQIKLIGCELQPQH